MKTKTISILTIVLILTFCFTGCGQKPEESINNFFTALQKQDIKTAQTFIKSEKSSNLTFDNAQQEAIVKQVFSKIKYEIVSSKVEGNIAKVKTKITSPDLLTITGNMLKDLLPTIFASALAGNESPHSDKLIEQYYLNKLGDPSVSMTTSEVEISLEKDSKSKTWIIVPSDDLSNAMTGNLLKAFSELYQSENTTSDDQSNQITPDPNVYSIGNEAKIGRAAITVTKVELSSGTEYEKPKDGMEYIIVHIKERNVGNDNIAYNSFDYKIKNSKGQINDQTFTTVNSDTSFSSGELAPNGEVEGTIAFEVPKGDKNLTFLFYPDDIALLQFKVNK